MKETVRYTYRLRPGATAVEALVAEWHRSRYVWNEAVELLRSGTKPTYPSLSKRLTASRAEHQWLREGSQVAQQQTLRTFTVALSQSFSVKGRRRPRFKSARRTAPSLEYSTRGFSIRDGRLRLPKGVSVPVVWSRQLPSDPTSVRIYRDALGHWYASFVTRREVIAPSVATDAIGIDWGVSTTATTTNADYDLQPSEYRRAAAQDLAHAQRKMARRRRPRGQSVSTGYRRAKREAARVSMTAARRNLHASRVWARRIVADHELIAVEDFRPMFLAKSQMARKAADAAVGTLKRTLIEYAQRAGRTVVIVEPAYTTMTCSRCFARTKRVPLHERIFRCACGLEIGRDRNAARTILAVAERGHTSVDGVRHSLSPSEMVGAT
ncbi:RNA-guided endonuclease InsQ/TnpB family protein [Microbacterium sp. CH12i]|uniref:RNA-guided endonuclease InsQ/TnpB family protein n=1 Tax=Microbacterium sp. CH12i TaxID=1479651 RepID=UPI003FA5B315